MAKDERRKLPRVPGPLDRLTFIREELIDLRAVLVEVEGLERYGLDKNEIINLTDLICKGMDHAVMGATALLDRVHGTGKRRGGRASRPTHCDCDEDSDCMFQ